MKPVLAIPLCLILGFFNQEPYHKNFLEENGKIQLVLGQTIYTNPSLTYCELVRELHSEQELKIQVVADCPLTGMRKYSVTAFQLTVNNEKTQEHQSINKTSLLSNSDVLPTQMIQKLFGESENINTFNIRVLKIIPIDDIVVGHKSKELDVLHVNNLRTEILSS